MGNRQSTINWKNLTKLKETAKCFSIVRKEEYKSFIRYHLDKDLIYKDGKYGFIDFAKCFDCLKEASVFWLDVNAISNYSHTKSFGVGDNYFEEMLDIMGQVSSSLFNVKRDANGNISELSDCLGSIGEMLEQRNNMQAYMETSRYANNHAWTKQTSWDMPPSWK